MTLSFLRPLLLIACLVSTISISGCGGDGSEGHVEDKTPGGEATPAMDPMDNKAFDDYSQKEAEKAAGGGTAPVTP